MLNMAFHGAKGKPRIIFVDEDKLISTFYKEVLVEDHSCSVELYHRVGAFMERLKLDRNWDAVVIDMMMPHADYSELDYGQTDDGMLTGVFLSRKARLLMPEVPITILTNRLPDDFKGYIQGMRGVQIKTKFEFPPFEFAVYLNHRLGNS